MRTMYIKKYFLALVIAISLLPAAALAQNNDLEYGIKAGANMSNLTGNDETYLYSSRIGYYGGLYVKKQLYGKFFLKPEFLYSLTGSAFRYKEDKEAGGLINMTYASIPIMIQFDISDQLYIEAGPEINVNLSNKFKRTKDPNDNYATDPETDWKSITSNILAGFGFGAGYNIDNQLSANVRFIPAVSRPFNYERANNISMLNIQLGLQYKLSK